MTTDEAKRIFSAWAQKNGYQHGPLKHLTKWIYLSPPFYSAEAWLDTGKLSLGRFAFHIHQDGEVTKFKLKDPEIDGGC